MNSGAMWVKNDPLSVLFMYVKYIWLAWSVLPACKSLITGYTSEKSLVGRHLLQRFLFGRHL